MGRAWGRATGAIAPRCRFTGYVVLTTAQGLRLRAKDLFGVTTRRGRGRRLSPPALRQASILSVVTRAVRCAGYAVGTQDKKEKLMRRRKLPPGTRHHEPWCAIFCGGVRRR